MPNTLMIWMVITDLTFNLQSWARKSTVSVPSPALKLYLLFLSWSTIYLISFVSIMPYLYAVFPKEPVKRILALTETCLVERDPASYNIVTIKPFGEVSTQKLRWHQVIKILGWNTHTPNHFVPSSCTPVKINVNWTACLCFIMYELHRCKLTTWMKALESVWYE